MTITQHARALLSAGCVFVAAGHAHAGAWTQAQGDLLAISNQVYFTSDAFWDLDGDKQSQSRFNKYEINPYLEYGLRDDITLGANLFLQYVRQDINGQSEDNIGLADTELFLRKRLYKDDNWVISLQPLLKLPSQFSDDDALPRGGSSPWDAELSLMAGYSFKALARYHFVDSRIAYRKRANSLRDQVKLEAKLGWQLYDGFYVIPAAYATLSTDLPDNATFQQSGELDYDLYKLELTGLYKLDDSRFVQAGGFAHVDGRNTGKGYGFMLSIGQTF
tara:strand:- start:117 stop:944 length:828 start_codon:yes stop_codon:yes gene_type:complete